MNGLAIQARLIPLAFALGALAGCGALDATFQKPAHDRAEPVINRPSADGDAARDYLGSLMALQSATPAAQAEQFQSVRIAAETTPTTANRLRYALMLAATGHPGTDPVAARRQLSDLLARPELMLPSERALATILLADVDERLLLRAENRRLEQDTSNREKDRVSAAGRRLQAEQEENARLKRALEDAQKKLDAVTQVERSITGRGNPPKP
jgi:hypothetical protein